MRNLLPVVLAGALWTVAGALCAQEEPGPESTVVSPSQGATTLAAKDAAAMKREIDRWVHARYVEALRAARDHRWKEVDLVSSEILEVDPENLKAQRLKYTAKKNILDHESKLTGEESTFRDEEIVRELDEASRFPDDKRDLNRPRLPLREEEQKSAAMLKMEEALNQRVTLNLIDVDLEYVLHLLFNVSGVNIIADQSAIQGKRLTLQVNDMPLKELLRFIARNNTDIGYTVGETAVWINSATTPMLEPKTYPLTRGIVSKLQFGAGRRGGGGGGGRGPAIAMGANMGAGNQQQGQGQGADQSLLEDVITWVEGWTNEWPQGSTWYLDRQTLTLFVLTTPEMHERLSKVLDVMDVAPVQVLIRARFIEVVVDDQTDIGIDFPDVHSEHGDTVVDVGSGTDLGVTAGQGGNIIFTGKNTDPRFQMTMRALEKNKRAKLLSAPQILAINNQMATIDVSTNFQYVSQYQPVQNTVTGTNNATTTTTGYIPSQWDTENVGFLLEVMPSVGRDLKTIILDLHPVVDEVQGGTDRFQNTEIITETGASSGTMAVPRPVIDSREVRTKLVINDGDYVIIGGLMRNSTTKEIRRVPILGYIPLLGLLFRSTSDTVVKSNLIIVVQAEIVTPSGQKYTDFAAGRMGQSSGGLSGEASPLEIGSGAGGAPGAGSRRWHSEYTDEVAETYERNRRKEGSRP